MVTGERYLHILTTTDLPHITIVMLEHFLISFQDGGGLDGEDTWNFPFALKTLTPPDYCCSVGCAKEQGVKVKVKLSLCFN
jgi:hypothetical protein